MLATALRSPDAHTSAQAAITRSTLTEVLRLWSLMGVADLDAAWAALGGRIVAAVTLGQYRAASLADQYVDAVTAEQGLTALPEGLVQAGRFAGVAADGRPLDTLLREPVITVKTGIGEGLSPVAARARATTQMRLLATTTLQDTGRAAVGTATAARPALTGYVRMLNPPSCVRCVVLAGRFYRWSSGFARHTGCDCTHVPSVENVAGDLTTDPAAYLRSLTALDRQKAIDKYAGRDAAKAYDDGADLGRLVNARRQGLSVAGHRPRRGQPPRATPERIYQVAEDRADAIRLLRANGFIL